LGAREDELAESSAVDDPLYCPIEPAEEPELYPAGLFMMRGVRYCTETVAFAEMVEPFGIVGNNVAELAEEEEGFGTMLWWAAELIDGVNRVGACAEFPLPV
jgi:hypothetical protein